MSAAKAAQSPLARSSALISLRTAWQQLRSAGRQHFINRFPRSDTLLLTQRNVYILPTKAGWSFGVTLAVMLLAAINYQLNLGYALTFLLGGAALVSMHQTHANLRRLGLRVKAPAPVFAGEPATLEIVFDNPGGERHGVGLGLYDAHREGMAFCDVPAQGSALLRLRFTPPPAPPFFFPSASSSSRWCS